VRKVIFVYYVCVSGKMPCWYFHRSELEKTPSFCKGVNATTEEKYRREGAKLIVDAGSALQLYPIIYVSHTVHACMHLHAK